MSLRSPRSGILPGGFPRQSIVAMGAIALALTLCTAARAQRELKEIPDPDPEIERKSFIVADGFEVNLFAGDPLLAKPIEINFDAAGRLWVATSEVYPQIVPGQKADDKILILEDADGDGKADKTTVFASGLLIPTGVEPGDGGAYVADSTELLFLKDENGDGKADTRRVVLSGFGTEDTHHILHTLRWGYDGRLYMNQSIYIHSSIETPRGVRRLDGGGTWRFRPESMDLSVFYHGMVNPWGLHFDRFGRHFATDGAFGEGINYVVPGAYYTTAPDAVRILAGLNPGSPKECGLELLGGRALPDDWNGNALTNDFRANRVCRYILGEEGSGFTSKEAPELIKTNHRAFRPIDIKMGPDGAIYIADWYNPIIQHGEVDFRDPRRDHTHGRIWRVTAKGRKPVARPRLVNATPGELLDDLKAEEPWTRHFAKRVLKERGAEKVLPHLSKWVASLDSQDPHVSMNKLEALWMYQAFDVPEPALLKALLRDRDHRIRGAATRVIQDWADRLENTLELLSVQVEDKHPIVRLEAVRVLGHVKRAEAIAIALKALDRPVDRFLDYALWLTVRDLSPIWLPIYESGKIDILGSPDRMTFALAAVGSPAVVKPLFEAIRSGKVPKKDQGDAIAIVATLGGPSELESVLEVAIADTTAVDLRDRILASLLEAHRRRNVKPAGDVARLKILLKSKNTSTRDAAIRLAGAWKIESLREEIARIASDRSTDEIDRRYAIEAIAGLKGSKSEELLGQIARSDDSLRVRQDATIALAELNPSAASKACVELAPSAQDGGGAIVAAILTRRGGADALTAALAGKKLPEDAARVWLRIVRASGSPAPALVEAIVQAGAIKTGSLTLSSEQMKEMIDLVREKGDPARGEAIFRRGDLTCLKCHAIAGAGGRVGPSMESLGASAQVDYLIESILKPGAKVKENYNAIMVATSDGRVLGGIKIRQTDTDLILRDPDGKEISIPLGSIEEKKDAGSLMPEGLADTLTRQEFVDLVRFLSELGKIGSYAVPRGRFVRRWETPVNNVPTSVEKTSIDSILKNRAIPWRTVYSKVSGDLPVADLTIVKPSDSIEESKTKRAITRFTIDVTSPGAIGLRFNSAKGISALLEGRAISIEERTDLNLSKGRYDIVLLIDSGVRTDDLRVEIVEVPGSSGRAEPIVGD